MTIGERILLLLRERGMTQKDFSIKTGIPQSTISEWRSKRLNPAADKIMIICEALDVDPAYLITGTANAFRYEKTKSLVIYIRDTASDIIGKIDERIRELELSEEMEKENTLLNKPGHSLRSVATCGRKSGHWDPPYAAGIIIQKNLIFVCMCML